MKKPRMFGWLFATVLLTIAVGLLAPQQLPVSLYKLSLVSTAAVVAYWMDYALFPYARPDAYLILPWSPGAPYVADALVRQGYELVFAAAMLRRAVIVGCAMLAIGLGA